MKGLSILAAFLGGAAVHDRLLSGHHAVSAVRAP